VPVLQRREGQGRAGKGRKRKGLGRKIIATSARTAAKGMGRKAAL
jgi:hypothetical protein